MKPPTRRWIMGLALCLLLLGGVGAAIVLPRAPAIACLLGFQAAPPADLTSDAETPEGFDRLEDEARYGVARAWVLRAERARAPVLIFVHGVAPEGIRDGRIVNAVRAFGAAGFTVVAPELPSLVDPLDDSSALDDLTALLEALADGALADVHPGRIGVVGVSVGGALALRAVAAHRAAGRRGVRAVLAIGAPDDLDRVSVAWFAADDPAPESDHSLAWERRNAGAFARSFLIRAGLRERLGDDPDFASLAAWMAEDPLPKEPLTGVTSKEALAVAALLTGAPSDRAAARERVMRGARTRVESLSPSRWPEELAALRGTAVFLLHGHGDPLVPIEEARHLAARLRAHTLVSVLESNMVGHTAVNDVGLGEKFAHVVHMDDFFDIIGR